MSFGTGPYGFGPFGLPLSIAEEELHATVHSSRKIDMKGRYCIDGLSGEFASMNDVHQRIYLALAYRYEQPKLLGEDLQMTVTTAVRGALVDLLDPTAPTIRIEELTARWDAGLLRIRMHFFNYLTGRKESFEI